LENESEHNLNRLNHIKLITPEPELVDAFLREVCDIPQGWALGERQDDNMLPVGGPLGPGGELANPVVDALRGSITGGGFIAGNPQSRQFQILRNERSAMWAAAISTRDVDEVHRRCQARSVPVTPITDTNWSAHDNVRFFFCLVGGLLFEVLTFSSADDVADVPGSAESVAAVSIDAP
jgi:hypothetical protein